MKVFDYENFYSELRRCVTERQFKLPQVIVLFCTKFLHLRANCSLYDVAKLKITGLILLLVGDNPIG